MRAQQRLLRRLIIGIGRRPFDPDIAPYEMLVLPDRRDLLDPLDRVPAGRKRVAPGALKPPR